VKKIGETNVQKILKKSHDVIASESVGGAASSVEDAKISIGQELSKTVYEENRQVYFVTPTFTISGETKEELKDNTDALKNILSGMSMTANIIPTLQEPAMKMTLPYCYLNERVESQGSQLFISTALARSFMYDGTSLKDADGIMLGKDEDEGPVIMDIWARVPKYARNNSNIIVTGTSGVGKTTLMSMIMADEYANGTTVLIIDPKGDYKKITRALDGTWLNMAGGKNRINYFEVKNKSKQKDNDDGDVNIFDEHIRTIRVLFKNYFGDFSEYELAKVEQLLLEKYNSVGITRETDFSLLTSDDYFIAEDLYYFVQNKLKDAKHIKSGLMDGNGEYYTDSDIELLNKIETYMSKMVGADAEIMNGKTNISLDSKFICFDIMDLETADEGLKRTQYYNILTMAYNKLFESKEEKVMLVCDEFHMLLDKNSLDAVKTITKMTKRVRSYGSLVMLATQQMRDFLDPSVIDIARGFLNNSTYKFIMGSDRDDLQAIKTLFSVTEEEESIILAKIPGVALLEAGNQRMKIDIVLPDYVKDLL